MFLPFYLFAFLLVKSPSLFLKAQTPTSRQHAAQRPMLPVDLPDPGRQSAPLPGKMSMFSVHVAPGRKKSIQMLRVRCKIGRALNGSDRRIIIDGVVQEDVVSSAGKILIPAGSTVVGQGYCDPGQNRILAKGRWTFYLNDHQIAIEGTLWANEQQEGLPGQESGTGFAESKIKQTVYQDGTHLSVAERTDFVLRLTGNISVRDLGSAFEQ
jgi:hypothetical protein